MLQATDNSQLPELVTKTSGMRRLQLGPSFSEQLQDVSDPIRFLTGQFIDVLLHRTPPCCRSEQLDPPPVLIAHYNIIVISSRCHTLRLATDLTTGLGLW